MIKKVMTGGLLALLCMCAIPQPGRAQSVADCIEQLTLDYQKLASLKSILSQMYQGYQVLTKGYNAVKEVSQGNFNLHEAFLGGLYLVSPAVRQYPRVADIISDQASLISEYQSASSAFNHDGHFSPDELTYMMDVYNNLVGASLKNLDELVLVITDSQLRMSDAERLTAIDRIFTNSRGQLSFLRRFNDQAYQTAAQRTRMDDDRQTLKNLYGLN